MTAGVRTGKAQNEHMFYRFAPEIGHPICASTSTNYLSIGFAKRLRAQGPQHGATLGADHLVWGGPQRNSHAADAATRTRASSGRPTGISSAPVFDTSRKSLLSPKARDVAL